jgi:adenine deaminase
MATLNPARHYGLGDLGALTPGKFADMALYQDFETFRPDLVWKRGRLVAEGGRPLWAGSTPPDPALAGALRGTVKLGPLTLESLAIRAAGPKVRVIGVRPGQIVTDHLILDLEPRDGRHGADPASGIAKLAVWERYGSLAPPAVGLIRGLGLRRGAIGSTVSHDSHNLVVAGASDRDMLACAEALAGMGGGLAVCLDGRVLDSLALPLGGLMSDLSLEETAKALGGLAAKTAGLGLPDGADPFMTLSFMCLPVIPSLKLTAGGLVDVDRFEVVDLAAGS